MIPWQFDQQLHPTIIPVTPLEKKQTKKNPQKTFRRQVHETARLAATRNQHLVYQPKEHKCCKRQPGNTPGCVQGQIAGELISPVCTDWYWLKERDQDWHWWQCFPRAANVGGPVCLYIYSVTTVLSLKVAILRGMLTKHIHNFIMITSISHLIV